MSKPTSNTAKASRRGHTHAFAALPKNEKGGILVTEQDIEVAFHFLDKKGLGRVNGSALRDRLMAFWPQMTSAELKFLLGDEKEITSKYLKDLLLDNTITHFDPVVEAFKAYDPDGTGYIDNNALRDVFIRLGLDSLSEEDLQVLVSVADSDEDGRIGVEDFRRLLDKTRERPPEAGELGRPKPASDY